MKKSIAKKIAAICATFILLIVLSRAELAGYIKPFGVPFAFALAYNNVFPVITCIELFLSQIIQNFSFTGFVYSATSAAVLFIFWLFARFAKGKKIYICIMFYVFACVADLYFSFSSVANLICTLASIACGCLFVLTSTKIVSALLTRGVQALSTNDKICLSIVLFAIAAGLNNIVIYSFNIGKMFHVAILCLLALILPGNAMLFSLFYSSGILFSSLDLYATSIFFIIAVLGQVLSHKKWLYAASVCFFDGLVIYLLKEAAVNIAPTIIAVFATCVVPQKTYNKISHYILGSKLSAISGYLIEGKQQDLKNKLITMSAMFSEMQNCYRNILISHQNTQKAYNFVATEIKESLCAKCINFMRCYDGKDMTSDFEYLIEKATEKGKITFLDVPNLLASNCTKLNNCISCINQKAESIIAEKQKQDKLGEERIITSVQYGAIGNIFKELSDQFISKSIVNKQKSISIKNACQGKGLVCKECIAVENEQGLVAIYLTVRGIDGVNPEIISACNTEYNVMLSREMCKPTKFSGWCIAKIVPSQKYEVVCGIASMPKLSGQSNGDNYVFTKIDSSKYLLAIADGMGSGENANKISDTVIKLVDSYYKCGFSDSTVVSSINNMLLPISSNFSAVDISVVDTQKCFINFIKLGSTISVVKKNDETLVIDVDSLPAGATENIKPTARTIKFDVGDIVVMASDGVVDNFGIDKFCEYINNEPALNMQIFAESILEEAASRKQSAPDDMTVIAYKITKAR